jgi:hypothetical protein
MASQEDGDDAALPAAATGAGEAVGAPMTGPSAAGGSASGTAIAVGGLNAGEMLMQEISQLKAAQAKMREERRKNTKELRNAVKRKQRLKRRAKCLTKEDLLAVIQMRDAEERAAEAAAAAAADAGGAPAQE